MGLATFKGGIHPYEGKELSENQPIEVLMPKGELVYPVFSAYRRAAKPFVKAGEQVKKGQKIADAAEDLSVAIHCSIDGVVEKADEREVIVRGN